MPKIKLLTFSIVIVLFSMAVYAVDTAKIDQVRTRCLESNTQPDAAAMAIIEDFWRKSMDTLMLLEDTEELVKIRFDLIKEKGPKDKALSFYTTAYVKEGLTQLKSALDTVGQWEENTKRHFVERNLMILIADMSRIELVDLSLLRLDSTDTMVRYWAIRGITNSDLASQLKSDITGDTKLTDKIITALRDYNKKTSDILTLTFVCDFAGRIDTAASSSLLLEVADKRIEQYMNWTVTQENVDAAVLKAVGGRFVGSPTDASKNELKQRFVQLYSCLIQRFIAGQNLSSTSRELLAAGIIEIEDAMVSKMLPGWVAKFKTDIVKSVSIEKNAEQLFGTGNTAGDLVSRLAIDFGQGADGKPLLNPKSLPSPSLNSATPKKP